MQTVLVTGASGFVGSHVVPELLGAGFRVAALVRTPAAGATVTRRAAAMLAAAAPQAQAPAAPMVPDELSRDADGRDGLARLAIRTGDVATPGALRGVLEGIDAVVHLVALARDRNGGKDLTRINLDGTRAVLEAMANSGVRRLVHVGALGVQDRDDLHYASTKARAEAAVAASELEWTILKPGLLYGERDGFFNILAGLVRVPAPIVPVPGRGDSRFQPLFVGDLARCVRLSLERSTTIGRAIELGGPRRWTYRELLAEVARTLGKRRTLVGVPLPIIRTVARISEALHVPFPVATDQLRQLSLDNVGALDGVVTAFGFVPRGMEGSLGHLRRRIADQEPAGGPAAGGVSAP